MSRAHAGFLLSLNLLNFALYCLGYITPSLTSLLLILILAYTLYLYLIPIIVSPKDPIDEHIKFNIPLMCISLCWLITSAGIKAISILTPLTAFSLGVTLSLSPRYLYPQLFFAYLCLEFALIKHTQLELWMSVYHIGLHTSFALILPRLLNPKWVLQTFYGRLFTIEELPLSHRYFDPERFEPRRYPSVPQTRHLSGEDRASTQPTPLYISENPVSPAPLTPHLVSVEIKEVCTQQKKRSLIEAAVTPPLMNITGLAPSYSPVESLPALRDILREHNANTQDFINRSLHMHLELARRQLHADSAVLMWVRPDEDLLGVRAYHSNRDALKLGDYPKSYGFFEDALRDRVRIQASVRVQNFLPYYKHDFRIGGLISVPIHTDNLETTDGILILDRNLSDPWDRQAYTALNRIIEKIKLDLKISETFHQVIYDSGQVERLCYCLRRLNESYDLNDVERYIVESIGVYDGFESASYFTLQDSGELKLKSRWIHPQLLETVGHTDAQSAPLLPIGEVIYSQGEGSSESVLFQVLKDRQERSTLNDATTPADYLSEPSWILNCAAGMIALPVCGARDEQTWGVLLLTVSDESVIETHQLQSLRLLLEQIEVKLSLVNAHEQLKRMASLDGLTGLKNHITFQSESRDMLKRAERDRSALAFVLLDIDHFKSVNDNYGHPFGDLVLKRVAETLSNAVRDVDLIARYGGEEFSLVLHATDLERALVSVERARAQVEQLTFDYQGREVSVCISLGVACYPLDSRSHERLIEKADKALYQSKRNGRNRVTAWRDIAPDEQGSSVTWTRAPISSVIDVVDLIPSNMSPVKMSPLQQPQALSFNLDDLEVTPRERHI